MALRKRVATLERLKDILAMSLSELSENPDEVCSISLLFLIISFF